MKKRQDLKFLWIIYSSIFTKKTREAKEVVGANDFCLNKKAWTDLELRPYFIFLFVWIFFRTFFIYDLEVLENICQQRSECHYRKQREHFRGRWRSRENARGFRYQVCWGCGRCATSQATAARARSLGERDSSYKHNFSNGPAIFTTAGPYKPTQFLGSVAL